jgi:hypothetical protein
VPVVDFAAPSPSTVAPGGTFTLTWTSRDVSSCTASGSWSGSEPTSGSATITAPTTAGSYEYTLTCAGEGSSSGLSATATATEVVSTSTTLTAPTFTTALTASSTTPAVGATIDLSWAVSGATACTASGGDGTDGWSGSEPTSSPTGGTAITVSTTAGQYTYALNCMGAGGSVAQTVEVKVGSAPTGPVFTTALTATPSTVAPGGTFVLSWATTGATACTASGGNTSAAWSGVEPTSSPTGGVSLTASTTSGTYAYVLSCSGPTGSTTQVVNLVVGPFDCGVPNLATQALLAPQATVTTATGGALCISCSVSQANNVIDSNPTNYGAILTQVGLLDAFESLAVTNNTPFSGGQSAGFILANPSQELSLQLLQGLTITTCLAQAQLIGSTQPAYLSITTSKPFDEIAITDSPVLAVLGEVDVYHACVSDNPL